jgi:hypothetical protein
MVYSGCPKPMMISLFGEAAANVLFGVLGVVVAALDLESDLVGATVSAATERPDGAADRRIEIGAGPGDRARGKGRGVELVLGVEHQRLVEAAGLQRRRGLAPQEVQEVAAIESSSVSVSMRRPLCDQ